MPAGTGERAPGPLAGVRVVAVEQHGALPFATLHLADLGAEVIKVEPPGTGEYARGVPPFADGTDSLFFESLNRAKRSIALDLADPADRAVFEQLCRSADVLACNLRSDVIDRLRLSYKDLREVNARLVCCSITCFGRTGPRSGQSGYDPMVQALAGWMAQTGDPDGPPTRSGLSLADFASGMVAAVSILAALRQAEQTGVGCDCDVSMHDVAVSMLSYLGTWFLSQGFLPGRRERSGHPTIVPFQLFRARDGWLMVGAAKDSQWQRLAALACPALAGDPRFATVAGRRRHERELIAALDAALELRDVVDWTVALDAAAVPNAPVLDIAQALADPQVRARGMIVDYEHPRWGTVSSPATAARVGARRPAAAPAPALDADRAALLAELDREAVGHA